MANWTTANDLKAQLARLWTRGDWPRAIVSGETFFPRSLELKGPDSTEFSDQFESVRAWVAGLEHASRFRIEWRGLNHRVLGTQRLPAAAWVDSPDDAAVLAGKRGEIARLSDVIALTRDQQPALLTWLAQHPLTAIEAASAWPRLLAVVTWMQQHPRPGIYLRQVDIVGVDSKFIEAHRSILTELLNVALMPDVNHANDAIDASPTRASQFAARYGFAEKPVRVRFRMLDSSDTLISGPRLSDITLDAASFARIEPTWRRVFITENEINFLTFPPIADSIVLFGAGYGWSALAKATWLTDCALHYWGDIDTHGFAILNQLRAVFPHAKSLLMDRAKLAAHELFWGQETSPIRHDLPGLNASDQAVYDDLRDNRIRVGLRLEQERIGYAWVAQRVAAINSLR